MNAQIELQIFAGRNDIRNVKRMLDSGVEPSLGALSIAASSGYEEIFSLLLKTGNFSKKELGKILIFTADTNQLSIARILLAKGADPNAGTGHSLFRPVLLVAAEKGFTTYVKMLLEHKANPNAHDMPFSSDLLGIRINQTALMAAANKGRLEIVRLLLEAGADSSIKGIKGKTAYELIANRKNRQDIAKLLLNWQKGKPTQAKKSKAATPTKSSPKNKASNWKEALALLKEFCGSKPTPHQFSKKIQAFSLSAQQAKDIFRRTKQSALEVLSTHDYDEVLKLAVEMCSAVEASVFLTYDGGKAQICIAPWKDKFKTITAIKTGSANYGVTTKSLVSTLKKIDALGPFELCECGSKSVSGRFIPPIKHEKKLATVLIDLCPMILEDHAGKNEKLEQAIKCKRRFQLWWD